MPYIKEHIRININETGGDLGVDCAGDLNYFLTKTILHYLGTHYNYQKINDVIGALECCKLELYRRLVAPYEDIKIKENGDVYPENTISADTRRKIEGVR